MAAYDRLRKLDLEITAECRQRGDACGGHDTAEWLAVFDDTPLAQSAVDRVRNNAYDFIIDGERIGLV